jgi:hypothetical protein
MVRIAVFRSIHATVHQAAMYFALQRQPPPDGSIYAVLVHGPDPRNAGRPGFVHVAFPSHDWSRYVDRIDLLDRFQDLAAKLRGDRVETIQTPAANLKRNIKRNASQEMP